jgi:hypothetical protein
MYNSERYIVGTVKKYLDIIRNVKLKRDKMYITDILINFLTCHHLALDYCIEHEKFKTIVISKIEEFLRDDFKEDEQWFVENLKIYKRKLIDYKK